MILADINSAAAKIVTDFRRFDELEYEVFAFDQIVAKLLSILFLV
jgi:hypothetical protein